MRVYTTAGRAEFYCSGLHELHEGKHLSQHPREVHTDADGVKRPTGHHLNSKGERIQGRGHHSIVFVWVPGCVHIDDHDPHPLQGCDQGCSEYHLVAGDDPRAAATDEFAPEVLE